MATDYSQGDGLFNPRKFGWEVTVIGLGGIGSALVWVLTKLGVQVMVGIDFDEVEPHNVPNQLLYSQSHVDSGLSKVQAVASFLGDNVVDPNQTFEGKELKLTDDAVTPLSGVVVSAVDSMASRSIIWRQVLRNDNLCNVPLFFDGRIGGRTLQLYTIDPQDPEDVAFYDASLFSDSEALEEPCSTRATIGTPTILAGLVADQLSSYSRGEKPMRFIEITLDTMGMTTL